MTVQMCDKNVILVTMCAINVNTSLSSWEYHWATTCDSGIVVVISKHTVHLHVHDIIVARMCVHDWHSSELAVRARGELLI